MKRLVSCSFLVVLVAIILSTSAIAQESKRSEQLYADWLRSSPQNPILAASPDYVALVVVVSRNENTAVNVDISIFASEDFDSMPPIEILVQPKKSIERDDEKTVRVPVGVETRLKFLGSTNVTRGPNGLVAQPQIIANAPEEASEVEVRILNLIDNCRSIWIEDSIMNGPKASLLVLPVF